MPVHRCAPVDIETTVEKLHAERVVALTQLEDGQVVIVTETRANARETR